MAYRVDLTARAVRNLRMIFKTIGGAESDAARRWFVGLDAAIQSLKENPARSSATPENPNWHHLLYGSGRNIYRIIYSVDDPKKRVVVLHIRHGARQPLQ
jgi:toxin ParE1/3/4